MDVAELSMFLDTLGMGKGTQSEMEFETAANAVKNMTDLDDAQRLQLYGLYKQGTVGDVNCIQPSESDVVGAAKWYFYLFKRFSCFWLLSVLLFYSCSVRFHNIDYFTFTTVSGRPVTRKCNY